MAISNRPIDKFAFLFTGSDNSQFINDIRKVLGTLISYYGYPAEHVYVVSPFPSTTFTGGIFDTVGLNINTINDFAGDGSGYIDSLAAEMGAFIDAAKIKDVDIPSGTLNNSFFYFTGDGSFTTNPINRFYLHIATYSAVPVKIDALWLKNNMLFYDATFKENSHIQLLMQQSYCFGFWDVFSLVSIVNLKMSLTFACDSGIANGANSLGSDFTDYWTKGLMLEKRNRSGVDIYADEEITVAATSELDDNLLVSLQKAFTYTESFTIGTYAPKYKYIAEYEQYLGLPTFLIRDGDQVDPPDTPDSWWESKDIFLVHPEDGTTDDIYRPGVDNEIHVVTKNIGTHPVRKFWIGTRVFLSGGGGAGENIVSPVFTTDLLLPGESYEDHYHYDFSGTVPHRCIRAKALPYEILPADLDDDDTDDVDWAITTNDNEAQRNLDEVKKARSATPGDDTTPGAGEGNTDEGNPDDGAGQEPGGTTEPPSIGNLREFKEHVAIIKNIFKRKRKFILAFPEGFKEILPVHKIEWYEKNNKKGKLSPLKLVTKPFLHYEFELKPREEKELVLYMAGRNGKTQKGVLNIPFEILVETASLKDEIIKRAKGRIKKADIPDNMPFAGITYKIKECEGGSLYGTIYDKKMRPVKDAFVFIIAGNRRQSAVVRTNASGSYFVKNINPDNYILYVKIKDWKSSEKVLHLTESAKARVDFFMKETIKPKIAFKKELSKK